MVNLGSSFEHIMIETKSNCNIYTQRQKLTTTEHYCSGVFHIRFSSKEQSLCSILLPKSFLGLSNLSECHLTLLLKFYGVLYRLTHILGYTLKSVIANPKVLLLNSFKRESKLDLFFRLVPNGSLELKASCQLQR